MGVVGVLRSSAYDFVMSLLAILLIVAGVLATLGVVAAVVLAFRRQTPAIGGRLEPMEPPRSKAPKVERNDTSSDTALVDTASDIGEESAESGAVGEVLTPVAPSFRDRLRRARGTFSGTFASIRGRSAITEEVWEDLEEALIRADVGIGPATELLTAVRARVKSAGITSPSELLEEVKSEMITRLVAPIDLRFSAESPTIWLMVGVNGVGKTTTIGKLGHRLVGEGKTVVMAAGDTFRAAAAEQLAMWGERCGATVIRGAEGGDPSSVIFDAVAHAGSAGADVVLADTAGRLHTKSNLMEELRKVRRVADKGVGSVTEVLLVLDATTGQNGLTQAREFAEAADLTGVVLTKLDGSAKGGIVFAIQSSLGIPVKLVGLGEHAEDLVPFDAEQFVEALFAEED